MGVSMDQVNAGMLEAGKLLQTGMQAWNTIVGKTPSVATPPIVASVPAGGAVGSQPQGQSATPAGGLANVPGWVWLAGGAGVLWYLTKRRR